MGHWLLQKAVDAEAITWDKAVCGHLDLGVEPADRDDLRPRELVISYMVSKDGPTITGGIFADLPDNVARKYRHTPDLTNPSRDHHCRTAMPTDNGLPGVSPEPRGSLTVPHRPDRLDAIASKSASPRRGGGTHHLGGLYADLHHADWHTPPAHLPREVWDRLLIKHRTAAGPPHEPAHRN